MKQFERLTKLLGSKALEQLQASNVTVVGLGAVGSYAVEALARAGVGSFRLIDFDRIEASNLNRQLYALHSTIGQQKTAIALQRVKDINPDCRVEIISEYVHAGNAAQLLTPAPDLLVDAIDIFRSKEALLHTADRLAITTVSSMGAALRYDPSQIRVMDLMTSIKCPLARKLRKSFRKHKRVPQIRCVLSTEQVEIDLGTEDETPMFYYDETGTRQEGQQRRALGSLPTLTGIFGLTLANEAIRLLIKD
jgi:tRNA A37 threonylcarbamoyladenosine dehydratase